MAENLLLVSCDFEWTSDFAEPAADKTGGVANVWLYYVSKHGLQLQDGELEMYVQWSNDDPPEEWEFVRKPAVSTNE